MYCDNCGQELREGAKFCPKCGTRFLEKAENMVEAEKDDPKAESTYIDNYEYDDNLNQNADFKRKKNGKSLPATSPTAKSNASTVIRRTASTWVKRATARPSTSRARSQKQTAASVWAISNTIISQVTRAASKRSCRAPRRRPPSRRTTP